MDLKPIPPDGKVADLRNAPQAKTQEEIEREKQQRNDKVRRNLRILAIGIACYYFASAGYSWYQESQHEAAAVAAVNESNPLRDPKLFRSTFNDLLNAADTSLPTANAYDTPEGFVAVLSPSLEINGSIKPGTKELSAVQIKTIYTEAFPPESITAFRSFVTACERLADPAADYAQSDEILRKLGLEPRFDANEDNKIFEATKVYSNSYVYSTHFTGGQVDELILTVSPLSGSEKQQMQSGSDGASDVPELSSDVPQI